MAVASVLVGISVFKQPLKWVLRCINSVLKQSFDDWELVVRLDGPDALETEDVRSLSEYVANYPRIKLVIGDSQVGTFASYKIIFSKCELPYLCQLDADDFLSPTALTDSFELLQHRPLAPFSYSYCGLFDQDDAVYGLDERSLVEWSADAELTKFITFHFRLIRSEAYHRVGGYQPHYFYAGDYDLCLRLSELGDPLLIESILYLYRVHRNSASQLFQPNTHRESVSVVRAALQRRMLNQTYLLSSMPNFSLERLDEFQGPILVAGLHRSGTSLMCRILNRSGVHFPGTLLTADQDNSTGYYENVDFVQLHRSWFSQLTDDEWSDWGLSKIDPLSLLGRYQWNSDAEQFLSATNTTRTKFSEPIPSDVWALKDPRATLILSFWRNIFKQSLLVVGVYRSPWDVSDAFMRISHPLFREQPELILDCWIRYNESLLSYVKAYPHSCFVVSSDRLIDSSHQVIDSIRDRWGLRLNDIDITSDLYKDNFLHGSSFSSGLARLYALVYPRLQYILNGLDSIADLSPSVPSNDVQPLLIHLSSGLEPLVSIVIPTFNPCHFLLEAIASAEYAVASCPAELIIIDDGSNLPESLRILKVLREVGYNVISQLNGGLASARNLGFSAARSQFVLPLDDDNRLLSAYISHGIAALVKEPQLGWVYGNQLNFGPHASIHKPGPFDKNCLFRKNYIDACALIRKSTWELIGGYDLSLCALEDWDFWMKASSAGFFGHYLNMDCFEYRFRENSMLRRHLADKAEHSDAIQWLRAKHGEQVSELSGADLLF